MTTNVWSDYSTREAAELVGLPESTIRGFVRDGVLAGKRGQVPLRFSFRDLAALRVVKRLLDEGVTLRRVRRELAALRASVDVEREGAAVAREPMEMALAARGGHVVVRERDHAWRADTGQLLLELYDGLDDGLLAAAGGGAEPDDVAPLPVHRYEAELEPVPQLTSDEWFERGAALEETDATAAIAAYRRSLDLRPDCSETWINVGRLYAENGEPERGISCFEEALSLDPGDATALYNLGVVAQDIGRDDDAVDYYRRALEVDATLAEAHYNLATIFDRSGDQRLAIRHINEYRKLTRGVTK